MTSASRAQSKPRAVAALLVAVLFAALPIARASASNDLSAAALQARLNAVQTDPQLDDTARTAATAAYREALDLLRARDEAAAQTEEFRQLTAEAPQMLSQIRAELARPPTDARPSAPPDATLPQLESSLAQAVGDIEAARIKLDDLAAEAERRADRRSTIPQRIATLRRQLDDLGHVHNDLAEPEPAPARQLRGEARRLWLRSEIERLESEFAADEAHRDLLPARRDRAQRAFLEAERIAAAWQEIVSRRRQEDAASAQRAAERLQQDASEHPALARIAEEIAALTTARSGPGGVTDRINQAERNLQRVRGDVRNLLEDARTVERRLSVSGVNEATGLLLIRHSRTLPYPATLRRSVRDLRSAIAQGEFRLIVLEYERAAAGDIDSKLDQLMTAMRNSEEHRAAERSTLARQLLTLRRDTLDQAISDQRRLLDRLIELEAAEGTLLRISDAFSDFIAERLYWVRSVSGPLIPTPAVVTDIGAWLFDQGAWSRTAIGLINVMRREPLRVILAVTLLAGVFLLLRRCNRQLTILAALVGRHRTDAFRHTLFAVLLTILGALPLPAVLFTLAWLLGRPANMPESTVAIAAALRITGTILIPYLILSRLLRKDGLATAHFRWPADAVRHVRKHLRWFIPSIIPLAFILLVMIESVDERWDASIGRLAFIGTLLLLALFWQRILHPDRPVVAAIFGTADFWAYKVRLFWYVLLVVIPLATAIIAGLGYYATALSLQTMIVNSIWLLLAAFVVHATLLRWLFIARRRLALETARRARDTAATASAPVSDISEIAPAEERQLDIPDLDIRTRKLISTVTALILIVGLYGIWSDMLPALRMLDRVQLWPKITILEQRESPATAAFAAIIESGGMSTRPATYRADNQEFTPRQRGESSGTSPADVSVPILPPMPPAEGPERSTQLDRRPLTLADLGAAIVALLVTVVAIRNVPGLVEIIVLQRLPLDAGTRNAVSTIVRYAITIIGITVGLGALGITWSSIQWLAAALTFGLAFGLQEIFANFISGLIILLERPVRVGDVVTTNGISGTVSKIRMRATTIIDFDRKEMIIPNKMFITEQVINWTLSDPVLRLVITVGVSYDGDIKAAERALLEIAREHPSVLSDPPPSVVFQRFGDSTLDFDLRVFLPHIGELIATRHALHCAILERFRQENIEIAFPQRDLHIRSADGLKAMIAQTAGRSVVDAGGEPAT